MTRNISRCIRRVPTDWRKCTIPRDSDISRIRRCVLCLHHVNESWQMLSTLFTSNYWFGHIVNTMRFTLPCVKHRKIWRFNAFSVIIENGAFMWAKSGYISPHIFLLISIFIVIAAISQFEIKTGTIEITRISQRKIKLSTNVAFPPTKRYNVLLTFLSVTSILSKLFFTIYSRFMTEKPSELHGFS